MKLYAVRDKSGKFKNIQTYNLAHYEPARRLGSALVTPRDFLGALRANA